MKLFITLLIIAILIVIGFLLFSTNTSEVEVDTTNESPDLEVVTTDEPLDMEPEEVVDETQTVLGSSVGGRDIVAYHFGEGEKELLFVGGIHGGYSWNTSLVAYELIEYLKESEKAVPDGYKVTVIPVMNPDGLEKIVGSTEMFEASDVKLSLSETVPGRFNTNEVDLNRNFDCDWQEKGTWQSKEVSGGTSAFSEPESQAIRTYVDSHDIAGAVVWYSSAGGVFASSCHNGVSEETKELTDRFAEASSYPAYQEFNFYEITGDMVNWFAKEGIPAISVLLTTHTDVEWEKNKKGTIAFLNYFSE
jgi:murein tripeptide amidase MpaA